MASRDVLDRLDAVERELADLRASRRPPRWRYLVVMVGVLALTVTGVATGVTGDAIKEGVRNPASGFASAQTELLSNNGAGYTARLSNFNTTDGGGQVSGCRSLPANEPCLYVSNVNTGRAFEFYSSGSLGGKINVNGANARPFTTNATGVATGLNADRVDGKHAHELDGIVGSGATFTPPDGHPSDDVCPSETNCPLVQAKNVTSVTNPAVGLYCIAIPGANPIDNTLLAGLNYSYPDDAKIHVYNGINPTLGGCPEGRFGLHTTAGSGVDEGTPVDNARFWFAVLP